MKSCVSVRRKEAMSTKLCEIIKTVENDGIIMWKEMQ